MGSWQLPETPYGVSAKAPALVRWKINHEEGDFIMEQKTEVKAKKEKKEKKFNSDRVARQVKGALKAAIPNETFVVSSLIGKVEVMYPSNSKITAAEINTFKAVFCELAKIKKEELTFATYEKKAV